MKIKDTEIKKYILLLGLIILSVLFIIKVSKFLIFLGLILISGIILFVNYQTELHFDISPVFFLSIVITSIYGFHYTIMFVLLAGFIPSMISRGPDLSIFMYLGVNLLVNLVSMYFPGLSIVYRGIILSFVYSVLVGIISTAMEEELGKEVFSMVLTILVNVFYFWKLATLIIAVMT